VLGPHVRLAAPEHQVIGDDERVLTREPERSRTVAANPGVDDQRPPRVVGVPQVHSSGAGVPAAAGGRDPRGVEPGEVLGVDGHPAPATAPVAALSTPGTDAPTPLRVVTAT
jgi:hypothetical protein